MPHSEAVYFHVVLDGQVRVAGAGDKLIELNRGDIIFVLSGEAHAVRQDARSQIHTVPLLQDGGYVDVPPTFTVGGDAVTARLLVGRLLPRWPGGQRCRGIPPWLHVAPGQSVVNVEKLLEASAMDGGSSLLTRAATLLFVNALRDHPLCQALFNESNSFDPIARAQQFIELHPFKRWTVEILAKKVGMGRSNFAARFAAQTGKTPIDVLTEQRMKHAADFLTKTDLKIAEVSERVGYRSEAAFHHRFTSFFGISPGKLRRQQRQFQPES